LLFDADRAAGAGGGRGEVYQDSVVFHGGGIGERISNVLTTGRIFMRRSQKMAVAATESDDQDVEGVKVGGKAK
jgi:hypothetical protein